MLPVSQAVQASKATMARATAAPDSTAGDGFASLLQGLHTPPVPSGDAGATSGASAPPASTTSTPAGAPASDAGASGGAPAGNGTPHSPADNAAGAPSETSAASGASASAGTARATGSDTGSSDANGTPRLRRTLVSLTADGSAAAAAAVAAQLAQALQGTPGQAGTKAGGAAGAGDALASASRKTAPSGLATAWGDRQAAQGTNAATPQADSLADGGTFTLAQDAGQESGSASLAGDLQAGPGATAGAGDLAGDRAGSRSGDGSGAGALGAGLSALLARQGGDLASQVRSILAPGTPGATAAGTALRANAAGAPADNSLLYAQLMPGATTAAAPGTAGAATEPATLAIAPALGDERWSAALGQQALFMARNQLSSAQLTVSPPGLGPIQITLDMNHDQANAVFVSPHDAVRQAIEASLPQLRDMFSAAGLQLSSAHVQSDAGGMAWTAQQGGHGQGSGSSPPGARSSAVAGDAGPVASATQVRVSRGLLDTFA